MKTKVWIPLLCAITMIVAAACSKMSPDEVAVALYEGMRDNNPKAIQANCMESTAAVYLIFAPIAAKAMEGAQIKAVDTQIDGESAIVTIEITEMDGRKRTEDLTLVKVKGVWKAAGKK